jgi:hypothetical protein
VRRRLVGLLAVVVLAVQCWITLDARHLLPLEGVVIGVAVVVLVTVNVVMTRRRGTRVARTLRPDSPELIALQDDLLGRTSSTGSAPLSSGTSVTQPSPWRDPLDGFAVEPVDREQG